MRLESRKTMQQHSLNFFFLRLVSVMFDLITFFFISWCVKRTFSVLDLLYIRAVRPIDARRLLCF